MTQSEYFYDWGWQYEDNKETAYKTGRVNQHYRVVKYYKDGRVELMTDPMPREEAIERCKQIQLLDPAGQTDWIDGLKEERKERQSVINDYLQAKGRL